MNLSFDQWIALLTALAPVIIAVLGIIFKMKQEKREEVAHALDYVLKALQEGRMNAATAKNQLLGTGELKETAVDRLLSNVEINLENKSDYKNTVIPGVGLKIRDGHFEVYPMGLLNTLAHKATKYIKKRF